MRAQIALMTSTLSAIDHDLLVFASGSAKAPLNGELAAIEAWTAEAGPAGVRLNFFGAGLTPLEVFSVDSAFNPASLCEVHDLAPDLVCCVPSVIDRRAHEGVASPGG